MKDQLSLGPAQAGFFMSNVPTDSKAVIRQRETERPTQPKFFTLAQVTRAVKKYLEPAIQKPPFWLRAEISSGREKGGTFYCDLVETDDDGHQVAVMRATVWRTELSAIRQKFHHAGLDLQLDDGTAVGIQCSLQFHARYGLSLKVLDADPAFALGELELRRRELLLRLETEDLFEPNKQLSVPLLPQRIGVVTSHGSAAFNDFVSTLEASGFGFTIFSANAIVQGRQTEKDVIRALEVLVRLRVDVIVIIRGGGSRTDLASLDNEAIARRIANCEVPVWTGIGHETDESVLDFVANRRFKTPTAVSDEIVDRFSRLAEHTIVSAKRLRSAWQLRSTSEGAFLRRSGVGLRQGSRKMLIVARSSLERDKTLLDHRVSVRLSLARTSLETARGRLVAAPKIICRDCLRYVDDAKRRCHRDFQRNLDGRKQIISGLRARFRLERFLAVLSGAGTDLESTQRLLRSLDPRNSLKRGFSLSYDEHGNLVKSVEQLKTGSKLSVLVHDGSITSTVDEIERHDHDGKHAGAAGKDVRAKRRET